MLKKFEGTTDCYEKIHTALLDKRKPHYYRYRFIYRLKPYKKCTKRLIKRNYMKGNREMGSLGKSYDFDRAYLGYDSPYLEQVNKIKNNAK